jgi:hypothetical protein
MHELAGVQNALNTTIRVPDRGGKSIFADKLDYFTVSIVFAGAREFALRFSEHEPFVKHH